mgnify:CR=1 FL=1
MPAAMHDLRSIRENPEAFDAGLARRGAEPASARILEIDERRRAVTTRVQEAQARRNEASRAIGAAMGKGDTATAEALKAEVATLKDTMPALEEDDRALSAELDGLLAALPNIPADDVPAGEPQGGGHDGHVPERRRDAIAAADDEVDLGPHRHPRAERHR